MTVPVPQRTPHRPWLPGTLVAVAGLLASLALWHQQVASTEAIAEVRITQEARSFAEALELRLGAHVELLYGLRTLFTMNPDLGRRDFERVARDIDLSRYHAGVRNLTFVRYLPAEERGAFEAKTRAEGLAPVYAIHPPAVRPTYYVVEFLWPIDGNEQVLGLDIASQPPNAEAFLRARDTGGAVASAPFNLIQTKEQPIGVTLRVPVFVDGPRRVGERGAPGDSAGSAGPHRFLGALGATVQMSALVESMRREGYLSGLRLGIEDIGLTGAQQHSAPAVLLALEGGATPAAPHYQREVQVGGRSWRLAFYPERDFLSHSEQQLPRLLALGGVLVTLLLTALVTLLVRRRIQALDQAQAAADERHDSEERFRTVFSQAAVGVSQTRSGTGELVRVNQKLSDIVGYTVEELQTMRFQDITHPDDLEADLALTRRMRAGELQEFRLEKRYVRKDGGIAWVDVTVAVMRSSGGEGTLHTAVIQDITERKEMEQALRNNEQRLRDILNRMPVGVCLVQPDGRISFRNQHHQQICGYDATETPDVESWWLKLFPDPARRADARARWRSAQADAARNEGAIRAGEYLITGKDGQLRTVETSGVVLDGGHLVTMVDLSQRKADEEEIRYLAYYDPLTSLPNRRLLVDRLQQALAVSARRHRCGALLMVDLDNFKTLNETRGHDKGDLLLREVALRLRGCVKGEDTVARHGGDEFVVVLEDLDENPQEAASRAEEVGQRILSALRQPFLLDGEPHHSTLSMGVTVFEGERESADELIKRGDLAMYQAKAAGRNTLQFYDPQMQALVAARAALESDMRTGLQQGQFELFYQPQVVHGRITGAEALLRWRHPQRGFVSPAEFIPLAEDSGLILPLGGWVLRAACERLTQWAQRPGLAHLGLSVNVSAREFHQSGFVAQVLAALASTGADGRRLKLELTESLLLQDVQDTIDKMAQLRAYGVGFSLDDFGTGYSSLAYLKRLPLDELKIDQSFVRDVLTDPNDAAIARTIVALGTSLGLRVIAEGVETPEQRAFLERVHCHSWQGYLLSAPLVGSAFEDLVLSRGQTPL
ncbi:EAL domain-containing protein [Acidovorax sp. Leaf160]|uniref:bifunctional diguanylate cyclase/phosphodiesterase n=1 Tax=Acidovorax sp. Leaf160 TaxID=1736280 RepID=UPI0006F9F569|nr:EAL domain-containing protein [Acidovorax sp. Leaf160]KQR55503.1 diguanylate cyclase [Acidovorax sp. Leaf160]